MLTIGFLVTSRGQDTAYSGIRGFAANPTICYILSPTGYLKSHCEQVKFGGIFPTFCLIPKKSLHSEEKKSGGEIPTYCLILKKSLHTEEKKSGGKIPTFCLIPILAY